MREAARRVRLWRAILALSLLSLPISVAAALRPRETLSAKKDVGSQIPESARVAGWAEAEKWMESSGFGSCLDSLRFLGARRMASKYDERFLFLDSKAQAWREVAEAVSGGADPSPLGSPALSGAKSFHALQAQKSGLTPLTESNALREAVEMWAKAWCGNSNEALTLEMDDPNPDSFFQAENLGTLKSIQILWAKKENDGNGLAEASMQTKGPDGNFSFRLLLLISNPEGGDPKVTDWGPTGLPNSLSPYSQAKPFSGLHQWKGSI